MVTDNTPSQRISRRTFTISLLALGLGGLLPRPARAITGCGFLSTAYDKLAGRHLISRLNPDFEIVWDLDLPARGHATTVRPGTDEGLVVARRPGPYAVTFGLEDGAARHHITPARERHFYGHSAYSNDGRRLWMTENELETGNGVIGIYDAADDYRRIGEFPSGGIGPHQLLVSADDRTLVVANGGIRTHPDSGRAILNLATMKPSLSYIDTESGRISEQVFFEHARAQKLSIRHIALTGDGIAVGCQDQTRSDDALPLVYFHKPGTPRLSALPMPESTLARFNGYSGSVAFDPGSGVLAVSSPRGGLVGFWNMRGVQWRGHVDVTDGCGIAPNTGGGMIISSGEGAVHIVDAGLHPLHSTRHRFRQWDNHMTALI